MAHYKQLSPEEKQEFWRQHIEAWKASGQSQARYCEEQKIKKSTLGYWRTQLSRGKGFVEIPVRIESQPSIYIIIKDTIKLHIQKGFDPDLLIQLVKTLEHLS